uniref:EOG090X072S n=1 Tax=Lynceus sp. MCZ IZ 141354 TaxID=1930659 RepID=A0A9N6ZH65_9CRUS|nr:EOG090X072S [Lynceus sp. MCZ IZ 141354]
MRKEQQTAALLTTIRWKNPSPTLADTIKEDFFKPKPLGQEGIKNSLLSDLMAHQEEVQINNPFSEYAKFEGDALSGNSNSRKISIYLTMLEPDERSYPMRICVQASAKVFELIGLICFKYTAENRQPPLKDALNQYALFIAEDDGSPDADFPCLDSRETVSKFGFTTLALVHVKTPASTAVQIDDIASGDKPNTTEKSATLEGYLKEKPVLESTAQQNFKAFYVQKFRPNVEITLCISWDEVEIIGVKAKSPWNRNAQAIIVPLDLLVACEPSYELANQSRVLSLVYYDTEKHTYCKHKVECEAEVAVQVTNKLDFIMEFRAGHYRTEYLDKVARKQRRYLLT